MQPIKVLLADDHNLVRAGFRALLANMPGVEVIAEAHDGREALQIIREKQPDIAMLDIAMPLMNGMEVAARVSKEGLPVRVLILSMYADEEYVLQALQAGAAGYLVKGADTRELELALPALMRGESYLSPAVSKHLTEYARRAGSGPTGLQNMLTPRQREVLQMIAEGHSTKEIAYTLKISVKTVETHRLEMMARLGVHDLASLIRFAIRAGITAVERTGEDRYAAYGSPKNGGVSG